MLSALRLLTPRPLFLNPSINCVFASTRACARVRTGRTSTPDTATPPRTQTSIRASIHTRINIVRTIVQVLVRIVVPVLVRTSTSIGANTSATTITSAYNRFGTSSARASTALFWYMHGCVVYCVI